MYLYAVCCWNLEANPSARCVIPGSIISVNCLNFTGERDRYFPHNVQWFKIIDTNGVEPVTNSLTDRVRSDSHQLRFNGTIPSDDGLYCCKSHSYIIERGCSPAAIFNLSIALPPKIVQIRTSQQALIGDTVHLECVLSYMGKPAASKFVWQRFGEDIVENPIYSLAQLNSSIILTIRNVTTSDEGIYNCVVENSKHQADNKSVYLLVQSSHDPANNTVDCSSDMSYQITVGLDLTTATATTTTSTDTPAHCNLLKVCLYHTAYIYVQTFSQH